MASSARTPHSCLANLKLTLTLTTTRVHVL